MRWILLGALVFLLSACSFFQIEVPPDAYSVETALQILENQEYRLVDIKEVDQYREVEMKGKVAIFESKTGDVLLLYAYRGEDVKRVWNAVKKKTGFLSVRSILELPNMGKFSTVVDGKRIVSWWKKSWFFTVEGRNGVDEFVKHVFRVYGVLKG
ncbi:DUF3242 domain-containing protein [Thermotoga sp. SG1]|uniref:DUF3242 domain-containing protein n=1 Tax=Thermotoga sp. SG1 TaxID=126739 RepID=UPI000C779B8F|nr:DUF3242 domain-containing protein [Thermotoga sp. SG1]PLV55498.1 hypothetical protein AS006_07590 [Thermotoga sp. SG1]